MIDSSSTAAKHLIGTSWPRADLLNWREELRRSHHKEEILAGMLHRAIQRMITK
jgi:hypothetical protein